MDARPARQDYIATLDLLRLAAALAVVFFHYFFRGPAAGDLADGSFADVAPIAIYGYLG
ncbi:acyltransferase, partial [Mesorhizobium sp. M8A.F.Ca.ET.213.01.1.1]